MCSSPATISSIYLSNILCTFLILSIWHILIHRTPSLLPCFQPVCVQIATLINGYNDWHLQKVAGVDNVLASVVMTANRIWKWKRGIPAVGGVLWRWGGFLGSHWTIYAWPCSIYIIYNSQLDWLLILFSATTWPFSQPNTRQIEPQTFFELCPFDCCVNKWQKTKKKGKQTKTKLYPWAYDEM